MAITITEAAASEVKRIIDENREQLPDPDATAIRMGVKGGGCSGFGYDLQLTDQIGERDKIFEAHGVKVICDPKSYLYLNGVELDFKTTMMQSGFTFNNPNATKTCGCGTSFSA